MGESKKCKSCFIDQPINDFYKKSSTGRLDCVCKKCRIAGKKAFKSETHKVCKHCNEEKPLSEYQKAGGGKWPQPYCKPCDAERKRKHFKENETEIKIKNKEYYLKTRVLVDAEQKEASRKEVTRKMREGLAKYTESNPPMSKEERKSKKREQDKRYRQLNSEKVKAKKVEYQKSGRATEVAKAWQKKKMNDPVFRIKKNLRGRIYVALKREVKSESTMKLLGCSIEFFREYFESLFTEGMSWEAYMAGEIHIDHIKPCKEFSLTDPDEQRKCFHYSNLQPLWELDNLKKGSKYEKEGKHG